jgi:integrase
MEIIKQKKGTKYREMIWINGKPFKSPLFTRKTDCHKWLSEKKARKNESQILGLPEKMLEDITLQSYSDKWLTSKESSGLARSTMLGYRAAFKNHVLPRLGHLPLRKVLKTNLESLQSELMKNHNAKGTNIIMTMVKASLRDAHRDGYIGRNPSEYLSSLKEDPGTEAYWTTSEIKQFLWANKDDDLHDLFLVAINTGMRRGELAGLCWDRVDFSLNQIEITRTRDNVETKDRTKTALRRVIPMNAIVRAVLLRRFNDRLPGSYIFTDKTGYPIETHHLYRRFARAQKKAKIENHIPFHGTRHTFATQFMMNGGNVFDLQKILGHTDIKMTMRYAHYSRDHLQKAMVGFSLGEDQNESNQNLTTILKSEEKVLLHSPRERKTQSKKAEGF